MWFRRSNNKKTYNYICTHVDNFMAVGVNVQQIMDKIESVYTVKSKGPPDYYLGNDYKTDKKGHCVPEARSTSKRR